LHFQIARPRLVAIWLSGYYAGKRQLPTINIQALEKNRKEIERFCAKVDNLELPLMQAVEKVLGPNNTCLHLFRGRTRPAIGGQAAHDG
jgi:hypothetical protein